MPAGWGEHAAAAAAPVHVIQAAGWAVPKPGRGEPVVPATAPRGHQRTGEPQARRFLELPEGGQAGWAVDVQGVQYHPGGQADIGQGPPPPPVLELRWVHAGVVEAVADQGMLGRPITAGTAPTRAGRAGAARSGAGPVDRVDGDAAGRITQGGVEQRAHATCAPSVGLMPGRRVCQAASSSAWMAAWMARAARCRIISGVPQSAPSPGESGKGPRRSHWTSANRPPWATKPWARSWVSSVRCRLMFTMPPQAGRPGRRRGRGVDGAALMGWRVGGRAARARCRRAADPPPGGTALPGRPAVGPDSAGGRASGELVADGTAGAGGPALSPGLASGAGQLEAAGWAGGHPAASQQMQRCWPFAVQHGTVLLGVGDGGVVVAVVVGDFGGGRPGVGAADRRKALVAGDGDGAVVGWGGVEQGCHLLAGGVGGGGASGLPAGFAPLSRAGAASERRRVVELAAGLAAAAVGAGHLGGGPAQRGPDLLGVDLGDLVLDAVLVGPAALLGPADHQHPGALAQGVHGVGGLVAPDIDGVEAGLPIRPAAILLAGAGGDGDPQAGHGQAAWGVAQLGVGGQVADQGHALGLGHVSLLGTRWPVWAVVLVRGRSGIEDGGGGHHLLRRRGPRWLGPRGRWSSLRLGPLLGAQRGPPSLGLGRLEEPEVPGVLVVEASGHSAAQLQPVLLELLHWCLLVLAAGRAWVLARPGRPVSP